MKKNIKNKIIKKIQGFSLIELIVAIAIFSILASGVVYVFTTSYKNFFGVGDKQVMVQFAQEGMEAVRSIRDNGWQTIVDAADGTNRSVQKNSSGRWEFSDASINNTLNGLTRVIVVSDVQRSGTGSIVVSGGTDDPDTKKVTVTVSGAGITDYVLTTFLTNSSTKTWEQTDWSGMSSNEFWASMITASSSYSNISTSTVGQVSLALQSASNGSFGAWADLAPEVYIGLTGGWPTNYAMDVSPDGDTLYACGGSGLGISAFDISNVRENKINLLWNMAIAEEIYSCKVHPNGHYAYLGRGPFSDGSKFIQVVDLYTQTIVQTLNTTDVVTSNRVMDIVINAAQTKLLASGAYGGLYSFSLSADGSTLTGDLAGNSAQTNLITSAWQQWGTTPHNMWLDETGATPYLYVAGDNTAYAISKWNITSTIAPTLVYKATATANTTDLVYIGNSGSGNTFAVSSRESSELKTYRDSGSGFTLLNTFDPGTFSYPGVIYDGNGTVIIYSTTEANMYAVNVSNPSSMSGIVSDTSSYAATMAVWPQHYAKYVSAQGGFFFLEYNSTGSIFRMNFISRPETRPTPSSFSYQRKITIDSSKVQNGPHSSFPVLISESQTYLKTVANGGRIQSAKGHDILFTASDQTTILDHEIETYSSSTGQLEAWVRIPSLPSNANTDIYMFYGNSNITTPMERVSSVWDSDFQVVQHMNDLTTVNVASTTKNRNSKFNTNDATKYVSGGPLQSNAKIGYGQSYDASYDYQTIANHADNQQGTNDFTVEFWMKPSSTGTDYSCPIYKGNGNSGTAEGWNIRHLQGINDKLEFMLGSGTVDLGSVTTANAISENVWTHVVATADRDVGYKFYINGAADNSYNTAGSNGISIGTIQPMYIGRDWNSSGNFFKGGLDEVRVSKTLRSPDWIKTEYNNMNSTSTFYSIASEANATLYNTPGSMVSSIIDLGSSDKVLNSVKVYQSVPSGCSLTLTLEGSNNNSFTTYSSQAFTDNSSPNFTSSTLASLNNLRYFRYRLAMTSCNNNSETASLYSLRLNYR